MNIELLRQVQDRILREPERFHMGSFHCRTSACIAGWAICLSGLLDPGDEIALLVYEFMVFVKAGVRWEDFRSYSQAAACVLLDLSSEESFRLFHDCNWPERFEAAYRKALIEGDPRATAKIAWNRIEHFIATGGAE